MSLLNLKIDKYFDLLLDEAALDLNMILNQQTKEYLISLLVSGSNLLELDKSMFEFYESAVNSLSKEEQYLNYKRMGENALLKISLFPENINKLVGETYYRDMGIMGYQQAYSFSRNILFSQIGERFEDYIDIMGSVRCSNLSDCYQYYQISNRKIAKIRLFKMGMNYKDLNE